jgi:hypothetical protein
MKKRAGVVGQAGLGKLVARLSANDPALRVHLLGHSFGARLVSFSLAGLPESMTGPASPVKSLFLLQGAFSHHSFADHLPFDANRSGALKGMAKRVDGPLLTTHSLRDYAVGTSYPAASMAVAVSRLPEEMQHVLRSRLTDGLDYAAISEQMGRGSGAVRMLYLRALRKLRLDDRSGRVDASTRLVGRSVPETRSVPRERAHPRIATAGGCPEPRWCVVGAEVGTFTMSAGTSRPRHPSSIAVADDPVADAREAELRYVCDALPGISRRRRGQEQGKEQQKPSTNCFELGYRAGPANERRAVPARAGHEFPIRRVDKPAHCLSLKYLRVATLAPKKHE